MPVLKISFKFRRKNVKRQDEFLDLYNNLEELLNVRYSAAKTTAVFERGSPIFHGGGGQKMARGA